MAVFDSLATARAALEAVRRMHPGVSGVISIADTTGTAEDEAVIAAREATRSRAPDVPD